jgi:hypothetical protein
MNPKRQRADWLRDIECSEHGNEGSSLHKPRGIIRPGWRLSACRGGACSLEVGVSKCCELRGFFFFLRLRNKMSDVRVGPPANAAQNR